MRAKTKIQAPILDTIASSNDMKEIYTALNEAVAILGAKRDDLQNAVQRQKINMPSKTYDQWIRRVIKTEEEVKKLLARYDRQSESSQIICFLPPSNFSTEMKRKGEKVIKLLENINQLGSILVDQPLEPVIKLIAPYEAWVLRKTCRTRTRYLLAYRTSYGTSPYVLGTRNMYPSFFFLIFDIPRRT
ncbi:hypothetical protein LOK49_LG02G02656 [Camellia lanceoleosa]|uniref:Uncharacterized protein n=1 Tax=Camellia lanceoleosa TaxID=1840588 RepID=A0ACC0IHZ0_9ERIC|nr:hypothetical protein LOK49_LG02G02656 [Camellia lanceoleosa]